MSKIWTLAAVVATSICLCALGCGDGKLRTQGHLLKGGQPLIPADDEQVRVTFVPLLPDGKPPTDHFFAEFDREDGTFIAAGKDKTGLPPGKYRVAVEYKKNKKDMLRSKFDEERSPFVFDIDSKTKDLVVDIEAPPPR
jgi:hypothetical protein